MAEQIHRALEPEPKRPALVAWIIFVLAALSLCWPMLEGKFLGGPQSDYFEAGFSYRAFGAAFFKQYGSIPQWDPYMFGGIPYVAGMHGDIFYPTAWLRWILPIGLAINLGFALHIVLAGATMYGLLRSLRVGWAGAVAGGLAYQLTGVVISLVHPGHDGKLFVSAVAPLLFMGVVRAVRDRSLAGYGTVAVATGLAFHGHPQMSYYLMVAGAIWTLFWIFGPEGPAGSARWRVLGGALGAVVLGAGLYAIQLLPFYQYIPFSPRAEGGFNTGWEHATSFALPPDEILGVLLPMFDGGVSPTYFGANGLKLHTEYLGPVVILLALAGLGGPERRRVRVALYTIAILFLLVALGGATPFYRLWYEFMPMMKRVRAAGMGFFLVALPVAVLAGFGAERVLQGRIPVKRIAIGAGVIALLALLAIGGVLQAVAEDIARGRGPDYRIQLAILNRPKLRLDGARLLAVTAVAALAIFAIARGRLKGGLAAAALLVVLFGDLWLVARRFFVYSPPASVSFGDDELTARVRQTPAPYRVWVPDGRLGHLGPYPRSWLMAREIPTLFGYHANEIRYFDDVWGGKNDWPNQTNLALLDLFAIRFAITNQPVTIPGFHQILGPIRTTPGDTVAYLYQADTIPPYARVMVAAAKVPDDQLAPTVADPRFPVTRVALYPDTASLDPLPLGSQLPEPSTRSATVTEWRPGRMRVQVSGPASAPEYLVVAENWYLDWRATIDGAAAPVHRAQGTLLSVVLPPDAKEVVFEYRSDTYRRGRAITLASAAGILILFGWPLVRRRRPADG